MSKEKEVLKQLKAAKEQNQKLVELVEKQEEKIRTYEYEKEGTDFKLKKLEDQAKLAEQAVETTGDNPLVTLYTNSSPLELEDRPRYTFERIMFDHYRRLVPLWSVRAMDVKSVDQIEADRRFPLYANYVASAKAKLVELRKEDEGADLFGIELKFDADTSDA